MKKLQAFYCGSLLLPFTCRVYCTVHNITCKRNVQQHTCFVWASENWSENHGSGVIVCCRSFYCCSFPLAKCYEKAVCSVSDDAWGILAVRENKLHCHCHNTHICICERNISSLCTFLQIGVYWSKRVNSLLFAWRSLRVTVSIHTEKSN